MSARSGSGTARPSSARASTTSSATVRTPDSVPIKELQLLVRDYRSQQDRLTRSEHSGEFSDLVKRMQALRARELTGVINDLEDLIAGREHPAKRRGEKMRERTDG